MKYKLVSLQETIQNSNFLTSFLNMCYNGFRDSNLCNGGNAPDRRIFYTFCWECANILNKHRPLLRSFETPSAYSASRYPFKRSNKMNNQIQTASCGTFPNIIDFNQYKETVRLNTALQFVKALVADINPNFDLDRIDGKDALLRFAKSISKSGGIR